MKELLSFDSSFFPGHPAYGGSGRGGEEGHSNMKRSGVLLEKFELNH